MENNKVLIWLVVASLVVSCIFGFMLLNKKVVAEAPSIELPPITATLSEQDKTDIAGKVLAGIPNPTPIIYETNENGEQVAVPSPVAVDGSYTLNKGEYEDEATEDKAEAMAREEIESRDFKKAVYAALCDEAEGDCQLTDIESYKDITEFKIMDLDVKGSNNNKVVMDVKVYYFLDGDEDETEKARLEEFTIKINDLDFDDDFEDAEINEDYLDAIVVEKVYN